MLDTTCSEPLPSPAQITRCVGYEVHCRPSPRDVGVELAFQGPLRSASGAIYLAADEAAVDSLANDPTRPPGDLLLIPVDEAGLEVSDVPRRIITEEDGREASQLESFVVRALERFVPAWTRRRAPTPATEPARCATVTPEPTEPAAPPPADPRVLQLEAQVRDLQIELAAARLRLEAKAAPGRAQPDELVRLQVLLRERNEDCQSLRRELTAVQELQNRQPSTPMPSSADRTSPAELERAARRALVPRVERAVVDAIERVPSHVAAEAMRILGGLAAGDTAAWRSIKQAQDLVEPIYMARIGIHYRLLMRVDDRELVALELVQRERLDLMLKRYRR